MLLLAGITDEPFGARGHIASLAAAWRRAGAVQGGFCSRGVGAGPLQPRARQWVTQRSHHPGGPGPPYQHDGVHRDLKVGDQQPRRDGLPPWSFCMVEGLCDWVCVTASSLSPMCRLEELGRVLFCVSTQPQHLILPAPQLPGRHVYKARMSRSEERWWGQGFACGSSWSPAQGALSPHEPNQSRAAELGSHCAAGGSSSPKSHTPKKPHPSSSQQPAPACLRPLTNPQRVLKVPALPAKPWPGSSRGNYILPPKISPASAIKMGESISVPHPLLRFWSRLSFSAGAPPSMALQQTCNAGGLQGVFHPSQTCQVPPKPV